jgi:hypothetical protein
MPTYYDLLGVPPDAPLSEIQAGYEMQRRHAEWSGSPDPVLLAQYDAAWQVLSDPARRRAYDQSIGLGGPGPVAPGGGWPAADEQWAGYQPRQYPEQPRQPGAWDASAPTGRPPGRSECRLCGSAPAAPGRFRAHQGMIVLMRFRHIDGPFCRDCGLAVFRDMTASTLLQGWWGLLSFFVTIWTVAKNAILQRRFASLGAPRRDPAVQAPSPRPLDPGKPLLQRPAALGLLVPLVVLGLAVVVVRSDRPEAQVGKCVQVTGDSAKVVSCSERHDGKIVAVADTVDQCPQEAAGAVRRGKDDNKVLCVVTGR